MTDYIGMAALVTAALGGMATLVIGIATLIATIRGNREIAANKDMLNGKQDRLLSEATTRAYLQGVREGEARRQKSPMADWKPAFDPPQPPPPGKDLDEHDD